jgi:mannose-6-phosphate isomerase-like protein (cupin superfamily)
MPSARLRPRIQTIAFATIAVILAIGWASRERAFAAQKAEILKSQTITLDKVTMIDLSDRGSVVGKLGIYLAGDTPGSSKFVTGRALIDPGKTPHLPHKHPEEEIMVIEQGQGEIDVNGQITKIGPGSVMYTTPNVSHGIVNTGNIPIVFYFIKWVGKDTR